MSFERNVGSFLAGFGIPFILLSPFVGEYLSIGIGALAVGALFLYVATVREKESA